MAMEYKLFWTEFVCVGNNGRSPLAEMGAKRRVAMKGLVDRIKVSSSGCGIKYFREEAPPEAKLMFAKRLLEAGTLRGRPLRRWFAKRLVAKSQNKLNDWEVNYFMNFFNRYEAGCRAAVMKEFGFPSNGGFRNPIDPSRPVDLILYIGSTAKELLGNVYNCRTTRPEIRSLQEFVRAEEKLPDCWGMPLDVYRQMANVIVPWAEQAIDIIAEKYIR
jgi:protein-tyrosine-phosphatase